jgi:hypothetical protein
MQSPSLIEGVVIDTSDPQEMGRMKVWCPAIDGDVVDVETLPWVMYVSSFAGQAHNYPAGGTARASVGPVSYGMWAVPKIGAQVLIGFLYGDYNQRVYMGSFFRVHGNRSLPAGRNSDGAPTSDTFEVIEPQTSNLNTQFQGKLADSIARTRGAYERQVAQAGNTKTNDEGYSTRVVKAPEDDPLTGDLDPQTYSITTPGRHAIIMQDDPKFARLRIKTAEGHQIIFDDANERIYVSTAHGRSWIELDQDGHVHLYGAESISMSTGKDFNLQALGNVNISAGGSVNIGAKGNARLSACGDVSISGDGGVNITSGSSFNILAAGDLLQTASSIHLNGPGAIAAPCATVPSIVPSHEPWNRPVTSGKRNKNWKA